MNKYFENTTMNLDMSDKRRFVFSGSKSQLLSKLCEFMPRQDAISFITHISEIQPYLQKGESFVNNIQQSQYVGYVCYKKYPKSYHRPNTDYIINLKAMTIIILATVFDFHIHIGLAETALVILGYNGKAIAKLDASAGEKCLVYEAINNPEHIIDKNVFSHNREECINNDLHCRYKKGARCSMKKDEVQKALENLCKKHIFREEGNHYKFCF